MSYANDVFGRVITFSTDGVYDTYTADNSTATIPPNPNGLGLNDFNNPVSVYTYPAGTNQNQAYMGWEIPLAANSNLLYYQAALEQYVNSYYTFETQYRFFVMYYLAVANGLTNRAAYIFPILNWAQGILSYSATYTAAVQALATAHNLSGIMASTWDFTQISPTVPSITLLGAIAIPN